MDKFFKKWVNPGLFSFIFVVSIFTTNNVKKCPSSICCWDSNSQPLEHESPHITSRPGNGQVILEWTSLAWVEFHQDYLSDQNLHPALDPELGLTLICLILTFTWSIYNSRYIFSSPTSTLTLTKLVKMSKPSSKWSPLLKWKKIKVKLNLKKRRTNLNPPAQLRHCRLPRRKLS